MPMLQVAMLFDGNAEEYGLLTATANLLAGFDRSRVHSACLVLTDGRSAARLRPVCDRFVDLRVGPLHPLLPPGARRFSPIHLAGRATAVWRAIRAGRRELAATGAAVLHTHSAAVAWVGWRATRRLPMRRVFHLHGPFEDVGGGSPRFERLALRAMDRLIAISRFVADSVPPALRERVRIVPNGVSVAQMQRDAQPGEFRRRWGVPPGRPLVGIFGAIVPRKGHVYFLEAAALVARRFPEARFAVVGGPIGGYTRLGAMQEIERHVERLGLREQVILTGHVDQAARLMPDFDVVTMPSIEYGAGMADLQASGRDARPRATRPGEPFGMVMIEAMAHGVATIATDCGAPPEVITHGVDGLLVPPRDAPALAAAIIELLEDPQRRQRIGRAGHELVKRRFDQRVTSAMMTAVYEELAGAAG